MTIQEIYEKFNQIGCLTFATVNEQGEPETRIAHLRAYDDNGIYFMTMFTKEFYKQMKSTGKVSICGMSAKTEVEHDENGFPIFQGGYTIRMTGDVEEVSMDEIKAKQNPLFDFCIKDQEQYPAMVVICITTGRGDIFDYDFEKITRDNKLERTYFSYNNGIIKYKGLYINQEQCIHCGVCKKKCSFLAIKEEDGIYTIDKHRCDECGDCYVNCPVKAISYERKSNA
ncbi:MAG: 4Fe-4S binding protein [Eubacteriales bacterium]